jgi:hypothetical protein
MTPPYFSFFEEDFFISLFFDRIKIPCSTFESIFMLEPRCKEGGEVNHGLSIEEIVDLRVHVL